MNYLIKFSPKALNELAEASAWYDEKKDGLGLDFETEVFKKLILFKRTHYIIKLKRDFEKQLRIDSHI